MTERKKTRVLTVTPEQSRASGVGQQLGTSLGALSGTIGGAVIGRRLGNKALKALPQGAKAKKIEALEGKRTQSAFTGAFLGGGIGTALGGGTGAATGLVAARTQEASDRRKKRSGALIKSLSELSKFDENKVRRDRGKFTNKGMSDEKKEKVARGVVTGALAVGTVADAGAIKAGFKESQGTKLPDNLRQLKTGRQIAERAKFAAGKASLPLQVAGLGAGLGASYLLNKQPKKEKEMATVGKSVNEVFAKARSSDDRKSGAVSGGLIGAGAGAATGGAIQRKQGKAVSASGTKAVNSALKAPGASLWGVTERYNRGVAREAKGAKMMSGGKKAIAAGGVLAAAGAGNALHHKFKKNAPSTSVDALFAKARS